ncbi:hypothetical protein V1522DRAFT_138298 [Lipomyces starkeyi]
MQRDTVASPLNKAAFIAQFKRPYEGSVGTSRSVSSHNMRKAPKSYYYSRPHLRTNLVCLVTNDIE